MQCVDDIVRDQAHIWTSPFRLRAGDAKWLLPFGAAFGTAFHFDGATASAVGTPRTWATHVSTYGQPTILAGVSVGLYGLGSFVHNDRLRSTGVNGAEAIVDTIILTEGLKLATSRFRPMQDTDQDGDFWSKGVRVNSSMPSGHAAASWAFAKVISSEYPDKKWLGWLAYGGAAAISTSRVFAMKHFPSDVVAGSVFGYLTGAYVSRRSLKTIHGMQFSLAPAYDPTSRSYGVTLNLSGK